MQAFDTREALYDACAGAIAAALNLAIAERGRAGLVVTGGASPGPVYDRLAAADVDWRKVSLTLSDDRWVTPTDENSNEKLVRERLLVGRALQASFIGLWSRAPDLGAGAEAAERVVASLLPVDVTLLGMGEDGHIASLYAGDPHLAARPDPQLVVAVPEAKLQPFVPRLSLSLHALLQTRLLILLVTGGAKKALIEQVAADSGYNPPVAALIRQSQVSLSVLWAP